MFFYSERIFKLLFPNAVEGYELLSLASFGIFFALLIQTISGILQGLGKTKILLISSVIGLVSKIIFNVVLIPVEGIFEKGAILGNIFSNIISFIILYFSLKKCIYIKFSLFKETYKPILFSIIMIIISNKLYYCFLQINFSEIISIIFSILIAIVVYMVNILIFYIKTEKLVSIEK